MTIPDRFINKEVERYIKYCLEGKENHEKIMIDYMYIVLKGELVKWEEFNQKLLEELDKRGYYFYAFDDYIEIEKK